VLTRKHCFFIPYSGYIPPEYIDRNVISSKFDIFSLGVVIIKIVTGPEGYTESADMSEQNFIDRVSNMLYVLTVSSQLTFNKGMIQFTFI
jgi:serine/threonine protein kinase